MNYYRNGASSTCDLAHNQSGYTPGKFGKVYINYLQEFRRGFYNQLITSNGLNIHVKDVEQRAESKYNHLLSSIVIKEKIDDSLKMSDKTLWLKKMEKAKKDAEEQTIRTVIFN